LPWLGIAADGKRHLSERVVHRGFVTGDGDDLADADGGRASAGLAVSGARVVRIARGGIEAVGLDPFEGLTRITSVATVLSAIAIDDLLGRSFGDTTASNQVSRFSFFGGRECPAGTTLCLVLNWGGFFHVQPN